MGISSCTLAVNSLTVTNYNAVKNASCTFRVAYSGTLFLLLSFNALRCPSSFFFCYPVRGLVGGAFAFYAGRGYIGALKRIACQQFPRKDYPVVAELSIFFLKKVSVSFIEEKCSLPMRMTS